MSDLKVATTYEEESGAIYQHFGHCKSFKIFHVSGKEITSAAVVSSGTYGHGGLATFLKNMGVEVLICGGIGGGAQNALKSAGIELYGGVNGNADLAVKAYLDGSLSYNPDVHCDHHDHSNHHDHSCGGHNEGDCHNEGGGHNCCEPE